MAKWKINEVMKDYGKAIDDALDSVGQFISDEEQQYALGQYGEKLKALDLGNLEKGFTFDRPNKFTVRNGNPVDYTIYVELGTNKMKPRPIMQTTIDTSDNEILDIMSRVKDAI